MNLDQRLVETLLIEMETEENGVKEIQHVYFLMMSCCCFVDVMKKCWYFVYYQLSSGAPISGIYYIDNVFSKLLENTSPNFTILLSLSLLLFA